MIVVRVKRRTRNIDTVGLVDRDSESIVVIGRLSEQFLPVLLFRKTSAVVEKGLPN